MGGSVSSGRNNDELIDNLVKGGLIKTQNVERVFRAVDRGIFYLDKFKDAAYRDLAWREGHIHISAPCIYTRVMESFEFKPNVSFLNIGSGTGYLSTMVGLIIGANGTNHNIEFYQDMIDYSKKKIIEFVQTAPKFDDFDFCIPKFVQGNFLNINNHSDLPLYDRVYVGMGVTDQHENFLKNLIKINGILIMPLNDSLVKIKRIDEITWETTSLMTVSFASLITENVSSNEPVNLPSLKPLKLQEICRFRIRQVIRQVIEHDHSDYYEIKREMSTFNIRNVQLKTNDNDDNKDEDEDENSLNNDTDFPLTRFERLFTPDRRGQINLNEISRNNSYFENQLRLMIYGRLIDPTTANSLAIAFNPETNDEETSDEEDIHNDAEESEELDESESFSPQSINEEEMQNKSESEIDLPCENSELVTKSKLESFDNNLQEQSMSKLSEEAHEDSSNKQLTEIKIPETSETLEEKVESCTSKNSILKSYDFVCESGYSENENESKSLRSSLSSNSESYAITKRKKNNSNGYYTSENDCTSSSSIEENSNELVDYDKIDKQKLDNNEQNQIEESKQEEDAVESKNEKIKEISSSISDNENDDKKLKTKKKTSLSIPEVMPEIIRENFLRSKILKLPISNDLKRFLLYSRDI